MRKVRILAFVASTPKKTTLAITNITLNLYPYTLTLSVGMSATVEISNQHRL